MEGFKFTDRDIREDNDLIQEAVQYALNYKGNFDLILDAKYLAEQNGTLPPGVARAVLNTALTDPKAHLEGRVPERPRPADRWRHGYNEDKVVIQFPTRVQPVKEKFRHTFKVKSTYHTPFIWSNEKIASVYHRVWQKQSYVLYRPDSNTFLLHVRSRCSWQIGWEWSIDQDKDQTWRSTRCSVGLTPPDRRACKLCETKCANDDLQASRT